MTDSTFGSRLKDARKRKGLTQKQLAEKIGAKHNSVSNWENDQNRPDPDSIELILGALGISADYLLGTGNVSSNVFAFPPNIIPMPKMKNVPVVGDIACGEPIYAEEHYEEYAIIDEDINCDFALVAHGDSMVDAGIKDGYVVFIRHQDTVEDGEIAAVILDDDATLKRVRRVPGNMIMLEACNAKYDPIFIGGSDETRTVKILGKAVAFQGFL